MGHLLPKNEPPASPRLFPAPRQPRMPLLESGENSREPARRDVGAGPGSGKGAPEMENVRV